MHIEYILYTSGFNLLSFHVSEVVTLPGEGVQFIINLMLQERRRGSAPSVI